MSLLILFIILIIPRDMNPRSAFHSSHLLLHWLILILPLVKIIFFFCRSTLWASSLVILLIIIFYVLLTNNKNKKQKKKKKRRVIIFFSYYYNACRFNNYYTSRWIFSLYISSINFFLFVDFFLYIESE